MIAILNTKGLQEFNLTFIHGAMIWYKLGLGITQISQIRAFHMVNAKEEENYNVYKES